MYSIIIANTAPSKLARSSQASDGHLPLVPHTWSAWLPCRWLELGLVGKWKTGPSLWSWKLVMGRGESQTKKMMKSESQWGVLWSTKEPENPQSRAVRGERCGGRRRTGSKMKFTVWLLPGFPVVTVKKHQLGRENPSQSGFTSVCGKEGLRHPVSSWLVFSVLTAALWGCYPCLTCVKTEIRELGELPSFQHPESILPRPTPKPAFFLLLHHCLSATREQGRAPLLCAQTQAGLERGTHPAPRWGSEHLEPQYLSIKSHWLSKKYSSIISYHETLLPHKNKSIRFLPAIFSFFTCFCFN